MSSFSDPPRTTRIKRLPSGTVIWEYPDAHWRLNRAVSVWRVFNAAIGQHEAEHSSWVAFVEEHVRPLCRACIHISKHYSTVYLTDRADVARYRLLEPEDTEVRFETFEDHAGAAHFVGGYKEYFEYLCKD